MSFDQRPARATKRVAAPFKVEAPAAMSEPAEAPKPKEKSHTSLFIIGALLGGLATTACINGLVPGIEPITLPEVLP